VAATSDGVGAAGIPAGINYRFCAVCGSSVYFDMIFPPTGQRFFTIALGSFVDAVFPAPTTEFLTKLRHPWVSPIPGAVQIHDPMGEDAESAWRFCQRPVRTDDRLCHRCVTSASARTEPQVRT
jgi:hypothetical protein